MSMILALLGLAQADEPTCDLTAPADAAFDVPIAADGVRVLVELWLEEAPAAWGQALFDAVEQAELSATVVVPAAPISPELAALLARVPDSPYLELAAGMNQELVPRNLATKLGPARKALRPLKKAGGRPRTVVAPIGSRGSEAMLGRLGFRELVNLRAPAKAGPRLAGHFEGQAKINVVFPPGPYQGVCGADPRVGPFTPAAADRAARAIQRASGVPGAPVVRVALVGRFGASTDGEVLTRWVEEVLTPGGASVSSARDARLAALQALRQGIDMTVEPTGTGRVVSLADARAAAEGLASVPTIPRQLPGELTPTEAFYAFALIVAGRDDGAAVRIGTLAGPPSPARSALTGRHQIPVETVVGTAKALLAAMPEELPAAMPVGEKLLTASELLLAMASVVRGDDPAETYPVAVPDPNERGLGWGSSTW